MINAVHLKKSFGENDVLHDISFSVESGDVISVIGSSGSGKSTMLRCINLLETPTGGSILFHGEEINKKGFPLTEYRSKVIMVFQSFNLFNNMSVLKNCTVGVQKVLKLSKAEAEERAEKYLSKVGMSAYKNAKPRQLSGGQKQRVAIAGIIAMKPQCIVLDEPTAMLDPRGRREVMKTVRRLNRDFGITVIFITHYMDEAAKADRIVVMDDGKIILDGAPKKVFSNVKTLKMAGLDVPQATELSLALREEGINIPEDALDIDELFENIKAVLEDK